MKNLLLVVACAAMLTVTLAGVASAGQNSAAVGRLYWMTSNTVASTSRNSTATAVQAVVTVKGLVGFKGVDIQLILNAFDGHGIPPAWQCEDVGPANGNYAHQRGGYGGTAGFPNAFTATPVLSGVVATQDAAMFYNYVTSPCLTPHGVGLIWLSAAGGTGQARNPATEYALLGWKLDLSTGLDGDALDPNLKAICILGNWRQPCSEHGTKLELLDTANVTDLVAYETGYTFITWHSEVGGLPGCPDASPAAPTTWGKLKRLYH